MQRNDFIKQTSALLALTSVGTFAHTNKTTGQLKFKDSELSKTCTTCGTQYTTSHTSLELCPICQDDRQYIPPEEGQTWTTHEQLVKNSTVKIHKLNEKIYELEINPRFAIGQRAFLIISDQGNILWDCIPLLDGQTVDFIKSHGGLKAIAFSHPHYYSNMNDWAETFDCPIYIHQKDEQWVMEKGRHLALWKGLEKPLWDGMRLFNIGGHFPGSSVLHVPSLSPEGSVFCGDTLYIAPSMQHISVMYSYPNRIPLPLQEMQRIKKRFETIPFDTLYGFYGYQNLSKNVKEILNASMERYI